jgi:hypothetical protein
MVRFRARLLALLALLLVALPLGVGAGASRYLCHAMDRVMDECCCPKARANGTQQPKPVEVKAPDCCEVLRGHAHQGPPAVRADSSGVAGPELATLPSQPLVILLEPELEHVVAAILQARAPPPSRGPPLFLQNCSFLT